MITIEYVTDENRAFWFSLDVHLSADEFAKKIRDKQGYVLYENGIPKGLLRYNLFWDNTPFCTMLFVECSSRKKGYGKRLMEFWEKDMKSKGYGMVMTSTQVNEEAQHFYRKLGYKDSGGFIVDIPGYEQPMEMIMNKAL
ncbi:MAG: GNAT family N-acetyltransferase [Clostridia bacterium]|nr:GNAT family N-acetyltransferase [Clostridia bacterium]